MILKTAVQDKLNYYLSLQERCMLDESQRSDFVRTELGYSGEQSFVEMVGDYGVILWDATLSAPYLGSAQFDVLLITGSKIIHYDIKNFKGQFRFAGGRLVSSYNRQYDNPKHQLERAHSILERLMQQSGYTGKVESYLVFINEHFHVSGALDDSWLMRGQLQEHFKRYKKSVVQEYQLEIGRLLMDYNQPFDHLNQPIRVPFSEVQPGVRCPECRRLVRIDFNGKIYHECEKCRESVKVTEMLRASLDELYYVKGEPFTYREAMEWCGHPSRSTLQRLLNQHFIKSGHTKGATYSLREKK
ncbi:NERD domain-containing protein [Macrococcus brunensis]|uniref:NERD domain-containing protein n=1 Tax=Macrococcus brunensis TaxID=198483 RepID=A0A4R6BES6_9STAP|nr:nuclease-related domain-containing protein [Macrococcus brunensis]TDL98248.1 NERD domain-containing protein [Macrococcus brunensis]ULG73878.1 NERD domain-containing protein [Macrococcus brunensis]